MSSSYNQMRRTSVIPRVFLVIIATLVTRQITISESPILRQCGSRFPPQTTHRVTDVGGLHMTAMGTLRVLVVFASFPDDETEHPFWPAHQPPLFMEQFIDPDTLTGSQNEFNLTNYFHQMSSGQFHLVGDALWLETAHSQQEYLNGSYGRANKDILTERVDSAVDFSAYDHWTKLSDFTHSNVPDGRVDMIIMVWRSNLFQFLGEASLGYKPGFIADGKHIEMGFPEFLPFPLGSGVTCQYIYSDTPRRVAQTMIHELGHWLLGGPHPYNSDAPQGKHMFWGILCNGLRASSCANAYERERLGWMIVPEIQSDTDISLPDYIRNNAAYKFHPPNGEPAEFYYIENHQRLSLFDDITLNPNDKGMWLLHQEGPYMELDNLKIVPSDGYWKWESGETTTSCFSQALPVFNRGIPALHTGVSHRDQIPTTLSAVNWMHVYRAPSGETSCGSFFAGELFDGAFTGKSAAVFSPFSNPDSRTWHNLETSFCIEVVDDSNGVLTVRCNSAPLDASPVRRYLGTDPGNSSTLDGSLSLAWGSQWTDGQHIEQDVNWSELERKIGMDERWSLVYQGPATNWRDEELHYDTSGIVPVLFRVRVRDTQGKYSTWSQTYYSRISETTDVTNPSGWPEATPCILERAYPNPFNPSTTIMFRIRYPGFTTLKVYDVLGKEVATIVSAQLEAGNHRREFSANGLSSGIYYCRLSTQGFSNTGKIVVMR